MKLVYDDKKETYFLGEKEVLRVTKLLAKHGLAPDYSEVDPIILEQATIFGSNRHLELEEYFKGLRSKEELTDVARRGVEMVEHQEVIPISSEVRTHYKDELAGTTDLIGLKGEKNVLVDFKFTYNFNSHSVMWQLNLYKYLLKFSHNMFIDKLYCLWYNKPKKVFEFREIPILEEENVEKLLQAEREGWNYSGEQSLLINDMSNQLQLQKDLQELTRAKAYVDDLQSKVDVAKNLLKDEMEKHGVKSIDLDGFRITFVPESVSETYDYKKVIEDYKVPLDYKTKIKRRKAHVRISETNQKQEDVIRDIKRRAKESKKWKKN